jgi:hypothetical protein
MILDEFIEIKVSGIHVNKLKLLYPNIKKNDVLKIRISELSINSHIRIKVKCDICGFEKEVSYSKYNKNINNGGFYSCSQKCSSSKNKQTYFNKTGFDHQMLNPEIKNKIKETCLNKYGVESYSKTLEFKNKIKETCLNKYGVEYGFLLEKSMETIKLKYGVNNVMQSDEIKQKAFETNISRYGNKTSLLNKLVKDKSIKTMINRYGYKHALQNELIMKKMISNSFKFKIHTSGLIYQGKYEKHFLDFCKTYNIKIERGIVFEYEMNGKRKYYSDFYLKEKNLIIEIKSTWIFNKHKEMNENKKECVLNNNYNYILILDKNYNDFLTILN